MKKQLDDALNELAQKKKAEEEKDARDQQREQELHEAKVSASAALRGGRVKA